MQVANREENLKQLRDLDYLVTPEKVEEAVRRIVAAADPLQIILFGSRARGEHYEDSDVDIAVIIDAASELEAHKRLPYTVLSGLDMSVDMIVVSRRRFDEHRPWLNSVFNYIDKEGVILYDRDDPQQAGQNFMRASFSGRGFPRELAG